MSSETDGEVRRNAHRRYLYRPRKGKGLMFELNSDSALAELIEDTQNENELFALADKVRREVYGDEVYVRGLQDRKRRRRRQKL